MYAFLENFLEEIKFLLEKIYPFFSHGSGGQCGKGRGVKKPRADLSAVYLTVTENSMVREMKTVRSERRKTIQLMNS